MSFKVTLEGAGKGAKFATREEAVETMWMFYQDKMSRADFDAFIKDHIIEE